MLDSIFGLPVHPLIVHATTVVVPAAALAVIVAAAYPRFRRWAGWGPLVLAVASLVLVPLTTQSGESLQHKLPRTALIERHAHLADGLLPFVIALAIGAAGLFYGNLRSDSGAARAALPRWLVAVILVVAVAAGVGTVVQVVRIGHSGAQAAWASVG
jgi:hypothetical protein